MKYRYLAAGWFLGFVYAYNAAHPWWEAVLLGIVGAAGCAFGWWLMDYVVGWFVRRRAAA